MQYLVKQPDGFWAVWNTITDSFSCYGANLDELADEEVRIETRKIRLRWLARAENVEAFGRDGAHGKTWEDCLFWSVMQQGRESVVYQMALAGLVSSEELTEVERRVERERENDGQGE
jgi:hypothetical protein